MERDTYRGGTTRARQVAAALAAVLTGLAVVGVGLALLAMRPAEYTGRATLLVVPRDASASAAFYETLSQGKLIATYAELLRNAFHAPAAEAADAGVKTDFQVVPDTALIRITASGAARDRVESITLDLSRRAPVTINGLNQPFKVVRVAEPSVTRATALDVTTYAAAIGAIALVVGLTVGRVVLRARPQPTSLLAVNVSAPARRPRGRRGRTAAKASLPMRP